MIRRDGRDVWLALAAAGAIPASWIEDPRRAFRAPRGQPGTAPRRLLSEQSGALPSRVAAWPRTGADARALARDPDAVDRAEALARDAARRLERWDSGYAGAPPVLVVWTISDAAPYSPLAFEVAVILGLALRAAGVPYPSGGPSARWHDQHLWHAEACFRLAAERGLVVPERRYPHPMSRDFPISLAGVPWAGLPDPFEPLREIDALGFHVGAFTRDAIAMYARPVAG
jgi:hypothetical protein